MYSQLNDQKYTRHLLLLVLSLWALGCAEQSGHRIRHTNKFVLTDAQQAALVQSVRDRQEAFDPESHLLRWYRPVTANRYHSDLLDITVSDLRASAAYAGDLLDTRIEDYQERAFGVIRAVLRHQDTDTASSTYGIWPYFAEEPLHAMLKPDWNWADFIGSTLVEIYINHADVLPEPLKADTRSAILHACHSIKRRDVKPGYTNIAIMGTFVTYAGGYLFDDVQIQQYAEMRLKRFYDYTVALGGFAEYNSPTYTRVALDELQRMLNYVVDDAALGMIKQCYRMGWEVLASHFHAPSAQLCGPHSRSYSTLLRDDFYAVLNGASRGTLSIQGVPPPADYYKLPHEIPQDLVQMFQSVSEARIEIDTFSFGDKPTVGYSLLTPKYCFGTVNKTETWQQRRPYIAYWGTPEDPKYFRVQLLHDFEDFATGRIYTAQSGSTALTALVLATDGGDYHVSLDRLDKGKFEASDLRIRFSVGAPELLQRIDAGPNGFTLRDGPLRIFVDMLFAVFDDTEILVDTGRTEEMAFVDYILYSGPVQNFDLTKIDRAAFAWATEMAYAQADASEQETVLLEDNGLLTVVQGDMEVCVPVKPQKGDELHQAYRVRN